RYRASILPNRTLGVSHHPIPEWQWPAMEMDFSVAEGVDMSQLGKGQTLHLQVEQEGTSTASPPYIWRNPARPPRPTR
ncbi:copper/silver resistance periplasmic protein, partial [Aeromonas molluscorum 848]